MVRVPQLQSLEFAIRLYHSKIEIGSKDIAALFNPIGNNTVCNLKKAAKEKMIEENTPNWNALMVNTKVAYRTWGLDINDLESRYRKLQKLCLQPT